MLHAWRRHLIESGMAGLGRAWPEISRLFRLHNSADLDPLPTFKLTSHAEWVCRPVRIR
jgi:hypothetical protein